MKPPPANAFRIWHQLLQPHQYSWKKVVLHSYFSFRIAFAPSCSIKLLVFSVGAFVERDDHSSTADPGYSELAYSRIDPAYSERIARSRLFDH